MRWTTTPVGLKGRGHLGDFEARPARAQHHFAGEFHSCRLKIEAANVCGIEAAYSAMKVANADTKEKPPKKAEDGIAQVLMKKGHCPRGYAAGEAIAHYKACPVPKAIYKCVYGRKVVTAIRITHD